MRKMLYMKINYECRDGVFSACFPKLAIPISLFISEKSFLLTYTPEYIIIYIYRVSHTTETMVAVMQNTMILAT